MKLRINRGQKKTGVVYSDVIFTFKAQAEYTQEESFAIRRYNLGNEVIYNSEAAQMHMDNAARSGLIKSLISLFFASVSLKITIHSLASGVYVECKNLEEVIAAEEAVHKACENLKQYIDIAQRFDGSEVISEY